MEELFFFSRGIVALLAVFATGAMIALWHLRLDQAKTSTRLVAITLYFATLWVLIRVLVTLGRVE